MAMLSQCPAATSFREPRSVMSTTYIRHNGARKGIEVSQARKLLAIDGPGFDVNQGRAWPHLQSRAWVAQDSWQAQASRGEACNT